MTRTSLKDTNCSWAQGAEAIGDKWTILILRDALRGVNTFSGFAKGIGVSKKVLSQRLDHLHSSGLLAKEPTEAGSSRMTYQLTDKGLALFPVMVALGQWADRWVYGDGNQPMIPVDRRTRQPLDEVVITSEGRGPLTSSDVTLLRNDEQVLARD
ncbi:winged helix-turn-helix transcriptional regulator [Ruegeria jejuensis]|uniref:winged helix-turn-helix transcriptional regulator n=1 Tax=Ruegeria jejuensis TaxID=3233338 RepID=UPI00355ADF2F